jgi:hypothetical protein
MNVILTPAGVGASVHCLHYSEKKMPAYQSRCMHGMLPPCLRCAIQGTDPYIPQETREKLGIKQVLCDDYASGYSAQQITIRERMIN